jgi:hypothetical protein
MNFKFFNTAVRTILGSVLLIGLFFVVSCDNGNDEPEPELYELPGVYTFKKAELTSGADAIATALGLPAALIPTNITDAMASGLLAEAPCKDTDNGAVELKENKELFFACVGEENEEKAGTWSINSDTTQLNLNLSVSTGDLQLPIEELTINESTDVIAGSINNFPITKSLLAGFLAALPEEQRNAILAQLADDIVILVGVDIEFQKVE